MNIKNIIKGKIDENKFLEYFATKKQIDKYYEKNKFTSNNKNTVLKYAKQYCTIKDLGNRQYEIIEVFKYPRLNIHYSKNLLKIQTNAYDVDNSLNDKTGVYMIVLNNEIYIGSTTVSFRERFLRHYKNESNNHYKTYSLLQKGAKYKIIWVSEDNNENIIRKKEQEYINKYKKDPNYILINSQSKTWLSKINSCFNIDKNNLDEINILCKEYKIIKITNKYVWFLNIKENK